MNEVLLVILRVFILSFVMRIITGFCINRAKTTFNQNIRFIWFFSALFFIAVSLIMAIFLIMTLF